MLSPLPRRSGWATFAHSTQPYQPSPKGLSGRPAHRPFRDAMGRGVEGVNTVVAEKMEPMEIPMSQPCDLNRPRTVLEQDCTLIAVVEMSLSSWVIAGIVPGIERHPLKKLAADEHALLKLLRRWQTEAVKAGHTVKRVVVAFE